MQSVKPVHPGEIIGETIDMAGMSAATLAQRLVVPVRHIDAILDGDRGITAEIALRLAKLFGTPPYYWMVLQNSYDLAIAQRNNREVIEKIACMATENGQAIETGVVARGGVSGTAVSVTAYA